MSFLVNQSGFTPEWKSNSIDTANYLIDLFGLSHDKYFMKLYNQIDNLKVGESIRHNDTGIIIVRY